MKLNDNKLKTMKEMWDRSGQEKDPMKALHFLNKGKPVNENIYDDIACELSERLKLTKNDSLLEVGCGNGLLLKRLKNQAKYVFGVDLSIEMLKQIKDPQIKTVQAEASNLPFENCVFDKIVSHSIFHYFPNLKYAENSVLEMVRVCKPGGRIVISDILNGYLKEIYLKEMQSRLSLKNKVRNIIRSCYCKIKRKECINSTPLFIEPLFFKNLFLDSKDKVYVLLETVDSKPKPFLMFRYDVIICKGEIGNGKLKCT